MAPVWPTGWWPPRAEQEPELAWRCSGPLELRWMRLAGLKAPGSAAQNQSEASLNGCRLAEPPDPDPPRLTLYCRLFWGVKTPAPKLPSGARKTAGKSLASTSWRSAAACWWRWCSGPRSSVVWTAPLTLGWMSWEQLAPGGAPHKAHPLSASGALNFERAQRRADFVAVAMRRASPPPRPPSTVWASSPAGIPHEG